MECTYIDEVDDEFELSSLKADETLTGVGERHEKEIDGSKWFVGALNCEENQRWI